jgi:drug/metabolite transporter (DMT)-like permease
MNQRGSYGDWLVFLVLGFLWGSAYLFIKIGVETLTPWTLIASRLGIGTVVLGSVVALTRQPFPRETRVYGHLLVMAVVYIAIPFFLITTAEQTVDSALAAIINAAVPLFVIVIAAVFLHDEPITPNRVAGLAIGFVGVVVLVGGAASGSSSLYGELALLGSTIAYASAGVYARRNLRGVSPVITAFSQVAFAFGIATVMALALEHPFATVVRPDTVVAIVWLGSLSSGLAYVAFFRLLGRWGATRASLVAYMFPVVGIVLGVLVLGEPLDTRRVAGAALIVGGVALVSSTAGLRRYLRTRQAPAAD